MLISLWKLKTAVSRKRLLGGGVEESLIGQFWPYKAWWYQISQNKNFGLLFQKWSLGTQESFCKVSDQLDTQLNNYGLISWHTSSINCVNNCTFIFTRHQPRLFLKALLVSVCLWSFFRNVSYELSRKRFVIIKIGNVRFDPFSHFGQMSNMDLLVYRSSSITHKMQ